MYNKHKCKKIMFQAIVDNKTVIEFNTSKKRDMFVDMINNSKNHTITRISQVSYPWNINDGIHNLKSPEDFAKIINCSEEKIYRAIKNGYLDVEYVGGEKYIIDNHGTYRIKDGYYCLNKI